MSKITKEKIRMEASPNPQEGGKRLWEVEHPYYCNEGNYYAPGRDQPHQHYDLSAAYQAGEDGSAVLRRFSTSDHMERSR